MSERDGTYPCCTDVEIKGPAQTNQLQVDNEQHAVGKETSLRFESLSGPNISTASFQV